MATEVPSDSRGMHGPICPCGHPAAGHFLAGCLDAQWFERDEPYCPCELTGDEAEIAAADGPGEARWLNE